MAPMPVGTLLSWPTGASELWHSTTFRWMSGLLFAASLFAIARAIKRSRSQKLRELPLPGVKQSPLSESPQSDVFTYFPPPPGTSVMTSPYAQDDMFSILTSGHLAAIANREHEMREQVAEALKPGPWRRHSYPMPKPNDRDSWPEDESDDTQQSNIPKSDQVQHFLDPDLNGIWRRRVLEFGND